MELTRTRLGRTGIVVPVCGLGGIALGRADVSDEEGAEIVRRAVDAGLGLIDTFCAYGRSELRIGQALKGRRHKVTLVTKSRASFTTEEFVRQIEASMLALGVDVLDALLIKNVDDDPRLGNVGMHVETLRKLQAQGKVRFTGLSSHSPQHSIEAIRSGGIDIAEVPYNYANLHFEPVLDLAAEMDVGILAMKPLGGGRLFPGTDKGAPETVETLVKALSFALSHPANPVLIPGIGSLRELERYFEAIPHLRRLDAKEKKAISDAARAFGDDFCRACGYCRQVCPSGIPIDELLPLHDRGRFVRTDETHRQVLKAQFQRLLASLEPCRECRKCIEECPFKLPVPQRLKEAFEFFGDRKPAAKG
jgi:predicted aldo/keto reductase-like oxidoreductase